MQAAAESGNSELCQFLVDIAGFPIAPVGSQNALEAFTMAVLDGLGATWTQADRMYRLLLQDPDIINIQKPSYISWWYFCPDSSCRQLSKDALEPVFQQWTLEQKVQMAFNIRDHSDLPAKFLEAIDEKSVNSLVAQACDTEGFTLLHKIAGGMHWRRFSIIASWGTFVQQLLEHGADIHRTDDSGETPLSYLLTDMWPFGSAIPNWVNLLWGIGVDLEQYGRIEMDAWKQKHSHDLDGSNGRITTWSYGPTPRDWVVHHRETIQVPRYIAVRLDQVPGGWTSQTPPTLSICWHPEDEDTLDVPWRWRRCADLTIVSEFDDTVQDEKDFGWGNNYPSGANDDCAHIVLALERNRQPLRARSYSSPGGLHTSLDQSFSSSWQPGWHRCLLDGKRKLNTVYAYERACGKGFHDPNMQDYCQSRIDYRMRQFRHRFRSKSELFALPYSAYRHSRNL